MIKKKVLSLVISLVLIMISTINTVSAQKFPAYTSGIQVQNLGNSTANVVLEYYKLDDGSSNLLADSVTDTISANSSKTYFPAMPFSGSLVISSDQPTAAVSNIQNSTKTAGAAYVGSATGSTNVALPLLMKGNGSIPYDTWFSVQNTGSANANIQINYSDCSSPVNATIKPNASKNFYQASETCHTSKVFSAKITSDQPIVVVALEENAYKMFAYTGFSSGSQQLVMPLINTNNSGITTGIQIQNISNTDTQVTLSYVPSIAGTACTETQLIPANSSKTFALVAFSSNNSSITTTCVPNEKFIGSAFVSGNTANSNLVAIVNQSRPINGEAYGAFNPASATAKVVLPLLMDRNGSAQWSTGFSVMNVGGASTYVKCTLSGTSYTVQGQLQPFEALTPNQKGAIAPGYVGSGTCITYTDSSYTTIDAAGKIVAVVNESGAPTADRLLVYEGINVAP